MSNLNQINQQRIQQMQQLLQTALSPTELDIQDESHLHAGHVGAQTGKGHFFVKITSQAFSGVSPVKQHQLIYQALGEMMQTDIHALRISVG
jgi:BolA family transcriptional regulator, general stress-responsive regulator